jgi:hypothetical protein
VPGATLDRDQDDTGVKTGISSGVGVTAALVGGRGATPVARPVGL